MPNPLGGGTVDVTQRKCQDGFKAFAGNCMDQTQAIMGKQMSVNMCACDSDQCNSAPFSTQISLFGLFLAAMVSAINNMF